MQDRRSLGFAVALSLPLALAACRSAPLARGAPPPAAPAPAVSPETQRFSDLVDELTHIGSHGAIDPAKDREAAR